MVTAKSPFFCSTSRRLRKARGVAEIGELVGVAPLALDLARERQPEPRLADQVEGDVGEGDVLLQHRGVAAPFGQAVAEHEAAVAQAQQVLERADRPAAITCGPASRGSRRRSGGGRPCCWPGSNNGPLVAGRARRDVGGLDHPDAHPLVAAGVDVAGVLDRHLGVGRVQAADMAVRQPVLAADEHLPERPFPAHGQAASAWARAARFSAWASEASRTQAPSSQASTRACRRSRLQGPLPLMTW